MSTNAQRHAVSRHAFQGICSLSTCYTFPMTLLHMQLWAAYTVQLEAPTSQLSTATTRCLPSLTSIIRTCSLTTTKQRLGLSVLAILHVFKNAGMLPGTFCSGSLSVSRYCRPGASQEPARGARILRLGSGAARPENNNGEKRSGHSHAHGRQHSQPRIPHARAQPHGCRVRGPEQRR